MTMPKMAASAMPLRLTGPTSTWAPETPTTNTTLVRMRFDGLD